jgi:hypothetical protein
MVEGSRWTGSGRVSKRRGFRTTQAGGTTGWGNSPTTPSETKASLFSRVSERSSAVSEYVLFGA